MSEKLIVNWEDYNNTVEKLAIQIEESDYNEGHLPNSMHIPAVEIKDRLEELEKFKDKPIVIVYRSGVRSGAASATLHKNGFSLIHNLAGGIDTWKDADLPIVKN